MSAIMRSPASGSIYNFKITINHSDLEDGCNVLVWHGGYISTAMYNGYSRKWITSINTYHDNLTISQDLTSTAYILNIKFESALPENFARATFLPPPITGSSGGNAQ